jgi:ribosomal protein S18 acetylase RimI-like enzyme
MQIRKAAIEDAPAIVENNILLANESEGEILDKSIVEQGVKNLLSHPKKGFYVVITEEEKIIGQLMITFEWSDWRNTDIWWIQSVYVHKTYRNKGVFSALFNEIKKQAKKEQIPILRLYVHKENVSAQKVYEKRKMKKGTYLFYEISTTD